MLYSKNGSIPKPFDESVALEGWIEVEPAPVPGEGQEVVWWYPPGWVVRPVKPADQEGYCWSWSQTDGQWVMCEDHNHIGSENTVTDGNDAQTMTSGNGADTITGGA